MPGSIHPADRARALQLLYGLFGQKEQLASGAKRPSKAPTFEQTKPPLEDPNGQLELATMLMREEAPASWGGVFPPRVFPAEFKEPGQEGWMAATAPAWSADIRVRPTRTRFESNDKPISALEHLTSLKHELGHQVGLEDTKSPYRMSAYDAGSLQDMVSNRDIDLSPSRNPLPPSYWTRFGGYESPKGKK